MGEPQGAPGTPVPSPSGAPGTPTPSPTGEPSPKFVTQEQLDKALADRVQPISDALGGITNQIKELASKPPVTPPAEPAKPPVKDGDLPAKPAESDPVLTERVKVLEEREGNFRQNLRKSEIRSSAKAHGLSDEAADDFTTLMLAKHDTKIVVGDDFKVRYHESDTVQTEIGQYLSAYFQSAPGQVWKPSKTPPSSDGLKPGENVDPNKFASVKWADVLADPKLMYEMKKAAPDQFAQIRAEADEERRKKR